jgi:hypothetical protein
MKAAADTTLAIAADPKRLGAKIGITAVLQAAAFRTMAAGGSRFGRTSLCT